MSLSADSTTLRRKRTATDRAEDNGDPLVIKKKARQAEKRNGGAAPAARNGPKVSLYLIFC